MILVQVCQDVYFGADVRERRSSCYDRRLRVQGFRLQVYGHIPFQN